MDGEINGVSFFREEDEVKSLNESVRMQRSIDRINRRFISLVIIVVALIFFEDYVRDATQSLSIKLFNSTNHERCFKLNKLDLYKYDLYYIFLFYLFAFCNLYSSICYMFIVIISNILKDILCLVIAEPRPFWDSSENTFPCSCNLTPSSISTNGNNSIVIFLTVHLFTVNQIEYKYNNRNDMEVFKTFLYIILFLLLIGFIIFTNLIPLLQNIDYLHQVVYGIFFGSAFYYWVFKIVRVDHLDLKQFSKIITQPLLTLTFIILLICLIAFIYFNVDYQLPSNYLLNIKKFCEIPKNFEEADETLKNSVYIFEFCGAYLGMYFEYVYYHKRNLIIFLEYNVSSKDKKEYNTVSLGQKLIIFILMCLCEIVFFRTILEFWVNNNLEGTSHNFFICLVLFFKGFFNFFIMKMIIIKIGLTNQYIIDFESKCISIGSPQRYRPIYNEEDD